MSMKNSILLQRNGRDQYGNKGSTDFIKPLPISESDEKLKEQHALLNDMFLEKHSYSWLSKFSGMAKKDVYKVFHYGRNPALSTFLKHAREFENFDTYLCYLLIRNKKSSLKILGLSEQEIKAELLPFEECGRYMVSYKGIGQISTTL